MLTQEDTIQEPATSDLLDKRSLAVKKEYQQIRMGNTVVSAGADTELGRAMAEDIKNVLSKFGAQTDGEVTHQDIELAQKLLGVRVDGIVGPETLRALDIKLGRALPTGPSAQGVEFFLSAENHELAVEKARGHFLKALASRVNLPELRNTLETALKKGEFGFVSEWFETGGRGPATIAHTPGDNGGPSYGMIQFSSNTGSLQKFLSNSGYDKHFNGLAPGSNDFDNKWRELAKNDPNFAKAQKLQALDKFYLPLVARLGDVGEKLHNMDPSTREMILSTAIQYGPNKLGASIIRNSISPQMLENNDAKAIVLAVQDHKLENVHSHFKSSSYIVRSSVAKRIPKEAAILARIADISEKRQDLG